jgi:dipeptidyl aminopeptidase/acylaminoacyl peptidase
MKSKFYIITFFAMLILQSCNTPKQAPAPDIAMKDFFKNGDKSSFRISPDGQYYSYRADYNGKMNVFVQPVGGGNAVRVTSDTVRTINNYFWKAGRIIYMQDVKGDENFQAFSVKPDGSDFKELTPFPGVRTEVLDDLKDVPGREKEVFISTNKRNKEHFDPFMLNVETGEMTQLYDNRNNFDSWIIDNQGVVRMAVKSDGSNNSYYYRDNSKDTLSLLLQTSFKENFSPSSFDSTNKILYVLTNIGRDKTALVEYDPAGKKELKELYTNPDYDLTWADYDRKTQKLKAVYWDSDTPEYHFFDPYWGDIQKAIDAKFTGHRAYISSYTDDRKKAIVGIYSSRLKGKYYTYDLASGEATEVSNPYPWLDENNMAETKAISYKTRDGLTLHGYLTIPKGAGEKNLPVVVNPHGGPWARDEWGFNSEVQFLANKGYAVLQVNYRGSTGYGKKFWEASFKQWGRAMQDDLTDGVSWLVKEGIADPKHVAIYGGSYGGYATLAGLTFSPDVYCCGVDYVGVANLFTFMHTIPPYWKPYLDQFYEMVGNPATDSLLLAGASPVLHADKIKVPLFIAQGANDPRVNKNESDQMVAALKARGITVEYMVKADEGHGFHNQDNQYDFYGAMEKFLAAHMKGGS